MSLLLLPKQYKDGKILYKTALDAIVTTLLNFFNSQKLGSDNVQTGGIAQSNLSTSALPLPIGSIAEWPLAAPPSIQWLYCYGQSVSTTTYPALFSLIGYTYGGSGSSFTLPDLRGRAVAGLASTSSALTIVNSSALGATGGNELLGTHTHGQGTIANVQSTGSAHQHTMGNTDHGHAIYSEPCEQYSGGSGPNVQSLANTTGTAASPFLFTQGNGFANISGTLSSQSANLVQNFVLGHSHNTVSGNVDSTGLGSTGSVQPLHITNFIIRVS